MGVVRAWIAAAALVIAAPGHAQSVANWRAYIADASARFGIPTAWIEAVMQAESRGRTTLNGRPIRSVAGAIGLMQLMPATWADMRARLGLGTDPDNPRDNILAGTFYLRLMYDRFGYPGLFAAYNAGPGRYAEHLAGARALPSETVDYLASVAPSTAGSPVMMAKPVLPPPIFAVRHDLPQTGGEMGGAPSRSALFIGLSQGN